jgi:putative molybdopterin biosynthesis protein
VDQLVGPEADIAVVRLVHRDQGLLVAASNPLGLTGIGDLTRPGLHYAAWTSCRSRRSRMT